MLKRGERLYALKSIVVVRINNNVRFNFVYTQIKYLELSL